MSEKRFQVGFTLEVPAGVSITRARLHLDAPGCAVVYANGRPGSDPAGVCMWTQWPKTQIFITHDLTACVQLGPRPRPWPRSLLCPVRDAACVAFPVPWGDLSRALSLAFFVACARY